MTPPRFLDAGECALVVEFGTTIDDALIAKVLALDTALAARPLPGLRETVPTYRSLMLHYDPLTLSRGTLTAHIPTLLNHPTPAHAEGQLWHLPACYDPEFAEDLPHIANTTGLSPTEVTRLHASATYRVVMYGFAPGWAYLSGLPDALTLPRRATPRDRIPAGALIIAGGQAIVAAMPMPSGWHILGRTPERLFAPDRDPAFLFAPGDRLRFDPVDASTFAALNARADAGELLARKASA
ncbi:MAG: 5-oxoprolinase subunit B family protein [Paracoccaceae bacterium]